MIDDIITVFWRDWIVLKRRLTKFILSRMVAPILYLTAFGWGLGRSIAVESGTYLDFLVPGILALNSMNIAFNSITPVHALGRVYSCADLAFGVCDRKDRGGSIARADLVDIDHRARAVVRSRARRVDECFDGVAFFDGFDPELDRIRRCRIFRRDENKDLRGNVAGQYLCFTADVVFVRHVFFDGNIAADAPNVD